MAAVLVAMEEEAARFLARATSGSDPIGFGAGIRRELVIAGRPVVLLRSGIGFANALAAAAHAFYVFGPGVPLISAGTAGGLARGIRVGEVVVGDRFVNLAADATAFGYALGQVPGMPESYESDAALLAAAADVDVDADADGASTETAAGRTTAGDATAGVAPEATLGATDRAADAPDLGLTVRRGTIGSSEAFVTETRALRLREDFPQVLAVDMESAALAQFAHTHGVPFLSVRGISDLCAPDGDEFLTHVDDAADRSAAVVTAAIMGL